MNKPIKTWVVLATILVFGCGLCTMATSVALVGVLSVIRGTPPRIVQVAQALMASPTSLPTRTQRPTFTITPLPTATLIATPTSTPTKTLTPRAAPTRTRTSVPAKPKTVPAAPTTSPYSFRVDSIACRHSDQSFVEGLVLGTADPHSGIDGIKVRMSADPNKNNATFDYETQEHGFNDPRFNGSYEGYFWFSVNPSGSAVGQTRYVWIVDGNGKPLSDPNAGKAVFNNQPGDENPNACWNVQIVFIKF